MGEMQKNATFMAGAFYVLGVLVTSIHISRFAVFDLDLAKLNYALAGAVCFLYLLLKFIIAVLIVDRAFIRRMIVDAQLAVQERLERMVIFRLINWIMQWKIIRFFVHRFTAESIARQLISLVVVLTAVFIILVYSTIFSSEKINITIHNLNDFGNFPPFIALLFGGQIAYILWCYLLPVFKSSRSIFRFWMAALLFLLAADVTFYSLALYPLVKPSFGGGSVYAVTLPQESKGILENFAKLESNKITLVHVAGEAYYLTESYNIDYTNSLWDIIQYKSVIRVDRKEFPIITISLR